MYNPIYIKEYLIYDIFHNDNNKLIIITPGKDKLLNIKYIKENNINFTREKCPHNHTDIYISNNQINYKKTITLEINGTIVKTLVNKYPEFNDEIIMSTMVKNEDNYIRQWIKFHTNIGINRFIIYDNAGIDDKNSYHSIEKTSNLKEIISDYIKQKKVIIIKWPYFKRLSKSSISGQATQQNHSIYAFQNSKYIGLFDIDEYINIQNENNITDFFFKLIQNHKINISEIGSFRLLNKFFYNPYNLPTNYYEFLKIYNCSNIVYNGHEKNFIIPKNVSTFCVHMITKGKKMYNLDSNEIYFNHYYFLNKLNRGKDKTNMIDNSISKHTINLLPAPPSSTSDLSPPPP